MRSYLIKRILIFLPVLLLISILSFWLSEMAPGDRVVDHCGEGLKEVEYNRCAGIYFLDRPAFYFSLQPKAYPDTLYRFVRPYHRKRVVALAAQVGRWEPVAAYDRNLRQLGRELDALPDSLDAQLAIDLRTAGRTLLTAHDPGRIRGELSRFQSLCNRFDAPVALTDLLEDLNKNLDDFQKEYSASGMYIPRLVWHGTDNRYHRWFSDFLKLDFGTSFRDSQPVSRKIGQALFWTVLISPFAFLIAFLISIPVGA